MKRIAATGAALVALLVASGCGAVEDDGVAARVGDAELSIDRFEAVLQAVSSQEGSGAQEDPDTGTVDGTFARNVLSVFVTSEATADFLAQHGESITDEDRQAFLDNVSEDDPARDQPEVLDLIVELNAGNTALDRIAAPDPASLQARYEESPGSLGVLCVRHVQVDDEASAEDIVTELAAGASIEDLVTEHSNDPSAPDNGGAIELTAGQGCVGVPDALQQGLPAAFVDAALTATPDEPVIAQTPAGWHVIVARPYDEIAEGLATTLEQGAGQLLFSAYLRELDDVRIDPRYGRWDPASGAVVAL